MLYGPLPSVETTRVDTSEPSNWTDSHQQVLLRVPESDRPSPEAASPGNLTRTLSLRRSPEASFVYESPVGLACVTGTTTNSSDSDSQSQALQSTLAPPYSAVTPL